MKITDSLNITGNVVRIVHKVIGGKKIPWYAEQSHNLVVTTGKEALAITIADPINQPAKRVNRMAWGDGGHEVLNPGTPIVVLPEQTALNNELLRKNVIFDFPTTTSVRFQATIEEAELVGQIVSEAMLVTVDGAAFALINFGAINKIAGIAIEFRWTINL